MAIDISANRGPAVLAERLREAGRGQQLRVGGAFGPRDPVCHPLREPLSFGGGLLVGSRSTISSSFERAPWQLLQFRDLPCQGVLADLGDAEAIAEVFE